MSCIINPDGSISSPSGDFFAAVTLGQIPGYSYLRRYGINSSIQALPTQDLWSGPTARVVPTVASVLDIASTSANDALAGTGMRQVLIRGLDANLLEIEEVVDLNGLTPVQTTLEYLRVNDAIGVTAGSLRVNEGNITVNHGLDTQAYINPFDGRSLMSHYTNPANKQLIIKGFMGGVGRMSGNTDLSMRVIIRPVTPDGCATTGIEIYLWDGANIAYEERATLIAPGTDLVVTVASTSATQAFATYVGYLVEV